jgi:hypothetical protein
VSRGPNDDPWLSDEELVQHRADWFERYMARDDLVRGPEGGPYACPCCGFLTLHERGAYDICPVCFWEDDGQDDSDADDVRGGPNGSLSLSAARASYQLIGACDPRFSANVRRPRPGELPTSE